jgi:hypothetical protein
LQEFVLGDFSVHIVHANLNFLRRVAPVAAMGIFDRKIRGMLCHRFCLKVDKLTEARSLENEARSASKIKDKCFKN